MSHSTSHSDYPPQWIREIIGKLNRITGQHWGVQEIQTDEYNRACETCVCSFMDPEEAELLCHIMQCDKVLRTYNARYIVEHSVKTNQKMATFMIPLATLHAKDEFWIRFPKDPYSFHQAIRFVRDQTPSERENDIIIAKMIDQNQDNSDYAKWLEREINRAHRENPPYQGKNSIYTDNCGVIVAGVF